MQATLGINIRLSGEISSHRQDATNGKSVVEYRGATAQQTRNSITDSFARDTECAICKRQSHEDDEKEVGTIRSLHREGCNARQHVHQVGLAEGDSELCRPITSPDEVTGGRRTSNVVTIPFCLGWVVSLPCVYQYI
jgi:hypothetical protein